MPGGVELEILAVPEALWQAKFEGPFQEHSVLRQRLDEEVAAGVVKREAVAHFTFSKEGPLTSKQGEEKAFAGGWQSDRPGEKMKPVDLKKRFIGTVVEIAPIDVLEDGRLPVLLKLSHDLAPPVMQRINYANAATGKERDCLSVEYPRFEKLEWEGKILLSQQWRLVTRVLRPQREVADAAPAMRYLVFIKRTEA